MSQSCKSPLTLFYGRRTAPSHGRRTAPLTARAPMLRLLQDERRPWQSRVSIRSNNAAGCIKSATVRGLRLCIAGHNLMRFRFTTREQLMPDFRSALSFAALVAVAVPHASFAEGPARDNSPALQKVLDCRAIVDNQARLACFDVSAKQLEDAAASGDITIVDREEMRRTRRGLFGFSLPGLGIFGSHKGEDPRQVGRAR